MHRAENVDHEQRLRSLFAALEQLHQRYDMPVVCSLHPRTKERMDSFGVHPGKGLHIYPPFGFHDFLRLEGSAFCILSDSGTVQEEACILGVPNVTIRDVTERPETLECGSNVLTGASAAAVVGTVNLVTNRPRQWLPPHEYLQNNVAQTVCRIVLSQRMPDCAELEWQQGSRH
jgi:UDP-N-acetylglucosamine 2-epimerase (non-hydrolysing)